MVTLVYDGTFEGWLTAVFEVFEYKFTDVEITRLFDGMTTHAVMSMKEAPPSHTKYSSFPGMTGRKELFQANVFNQHHESIFDPTKSARVWKGLAAKISATGLSQIYKAFLSEEKGIETVLLQYVQYAFSKPQSIECDYSHPAVLTVVQTAKKVHREKHRMEAFIRFQLTADNLYYAICQPDFNVLPLIEKHFKNRYADQRWLIYDSQRKYGIYYDLTSVETIQLSFDEQTNNGKNIAVIADEKEELYQKLWQQYFTSVNIAARKNTKLHIQHMPKRYWKFLPEKQPL